GEVGGFGDLHGTEDGEVDVAAPDHGEGVRAGEEAGAGQGSDDFLASVNEIGIDVLLGGVGADAQEAVLGLQDDGDVAGDVVGDERGDADAEVDVRAIMQLQRGP